MMWSNWVYSTKIVNDWNPRYELFENNGTDCLSVELPGVSRGDVKVNVDGLLLTIDAKRNIGHGDQKWTGKWMLGEHMNADRIEARLESGILVVSFPTSEKSKPREIEIQ